MDTQKSIQNPLVDATYTTDCPTMMPPPPTHFLGMRPHPPRTFSHESVSSYSDMEERSRNNVPKQRSHRARRRHAPSLEDVKHRRTRSGCYTCRQRRVKCDESHPVCDRCRKGKRECTYPESSSILKKSRSTVKVKSLSLDSGSNMSDDELDENDKETLPTILDTSDGPNRDESEPKSAATDISIRDDCVFDGESPMSPLTEHVAMPPTSRHAGMPPWRPSYERQRLPPTSPSSRWSSLPEDVKMLLRYYQERLSHHHYAFRSDPEDFFKTSFLEIAINDRNEALLYAVVAYAAYHRTFALEYSGITKFLSYYNKSIVLLKQSLNERPNTTTLLTILQLATIEEFLGDWSTLMGHQKAAYQIITNFFTPQTMMQDETHRQIIRWYIRFELFAGTMWSGEVILGREWFETCEDFYRKKARENRRDLPAKFEEYFARNRLLAVDLMVLVTARSRNEIGDEEFSNKRAQLINRVATFKQRLESAFSNSSDLVDKSPSISFTNELDIADCQDADLLYQDELFTMNYLLLDIWTVELMVKHQILQPDPAELTSLALKLCKLIEALESSDQGKAGGIIACQAGIGIASLFLPRDQKHIDWARRKFAVIEQLGYIYPAALRDRMSTIWGVDVRQSWLPDHENNPAALRNLREFIGYRRGVPTAALDPQLQHMSGIFRSLFADAAGTNGSTTAEKSVRLWELLMGFEGETFDWDEE